MQFSDNCWIIVPFRSDSYEMWVRLVCAVPMTSWAHPDVLEPLKQTIIGTPRSCPAGSLRMGSGIGSVFFRVLVLTTVSAQPIVASLSMKQVCRTESPVCPSACEITCLRRRLRRGFWATALPKTLNATESRHGSSDCVACWICSRRKRLCRRKSSGSLISFLIWQHARSPALVPTSVPLCGS